MPGFDKDEFWQKISALYDEARENNYFLRLNGERTGELKAAYMNVYIPIENLSHYNDEKIMRKMMTMMVSVYKLDKEPMSNGGELVQLVNSVKYDGRYLYMYFAKMSVMKLRRFELGLSQKQVAERSGYSVSTIKNCEMFHCDLSRQPDNLVHKLASALKCEPAALMM
ncbi:MAG: helix-turn-helix domain-containing protein [Roseburia sp.]|nr:helix-turn-helix domain-containing protein [Roseburia sp.]